MTGFINLDKEEGASSAKEVAVIKRLTNTPCGHMGTLDPMASGVLPVAIGNAARLFDFFLDKRKTYIATFRFGADSDTLDTTGNLRENAGKVPDISQISSVLSEFIGEIDQIPPKYSAKNISGQRGYQLARAGIEFELSPKKVNIYTLKLLKQISLDSFSFEIECGGGTYIRSIARDIAIRLNTVAVMSALVRTQSGIFKIDNAVKSKNLTAENIKNFIIPTQDVLPYQSITPCKTDAKKLFNGLSVKCGEPDGIYKIFDTDGSFYGLAEVTQSVLKVRKKLC
ncbi:MAG: tRNA pseudouridine(55) synthase TruB [Clostridia bacterium]|nr:tRNA pseudouridine(55) synthase TruB [Clostridia bacterium]